MPEQQSTTHHYSTSTPPPALIGGRYRLLEELGSGGMGAVYRAFDRLTGTHVALKQVNLPTEHLQFNSRMNTQEQGAGGLRLALAREFSILATLRHPNIISVYDYGFIDSSENAESEQAVPFYTMELLEAPQTVTAIGQLLSFEARIGLVVEMLQALAYLHRRGIIHRDLKPDNVLVHNEQVRLVDFGLAMERESLTRGNTAGTIAYMAPEIFTGQPASESSDLFAVGVMAYELLIGHYPFQSNTVTQLMMAIMNESPLVESLELPPNLKFVLGKLLEKSPADRPHDALTAIKMFTEGAGLPAPVETASVRESYLKGASFIGREREFSLLSNALETVIQPQHNAADLAADVSPSQHGWLIGGESGVGKSRLLEELAIRGLVGGILVLRGQAVSGGGVPYQAWRDPLRRLVLTTTLDDTETAILKATDIVPDIDNLIENPGISSSIDATNAQNVHRQLVSVVLALFRRQTRPILLILEDLQWANESLNLLKPLAAIADTLPLMIVGSYRDDEHPHLPKELPGLQPLKLERLSDQEIAHLSTAMLGEVAAQHEVFDLLRRESEGNAFFLIEVVRALAEESHQLSDIGRTTLPERVFAGEMQTILRRRLNRLPEWAKPLLKRAAILGRAVDLEVLTTLYTALSARPDSEMMALRTRQLLPAAIADNPQLVISKFLAACADAAVLEVHQDIWRFSHDKLRETVLADLSETERPALHREVAEAIEAAAGDESDAQALVLASLWAVANDVAKEAYYSVVGGRQAKKVSDHRTAYRLLNRAMAIDAHIVIAHRQGIDVRVALAELAYDTGEEAMKVGEMAQAVALREQALQLYRDLNMPVQVAFVQSGLGDIHRMLGRTELAQSMIQEALNIQREQNALDDACLSLLNLGVVYAVRGDIDTAIVMFQESHDLAETLGKKNVMAMALNNLGNMAGNGEPTPEAYHRSEAYYERALVIRREIDDYEGTASTLSNLGANANWYGDFESAMKYLDEALERYRHMGVLEGIAHILLQRATTETRWKRDYAAAEATLREVISICERIENLRIGSSAWFDLGKNLIKLGRLDEAEGYLLRALRHARDTNHQAFMGSSLHQLGIIARERGQFAQALALFTVMMPCFEGMPSRLSEGEASLHELITAIGETAYQVAKVRVDALTLQEVVNSLLEPQTSS